MEFYRDKFYDGHRRLLGKLNQSQVDGINFLLDRIARTEDLTIPMVAYILATVKHETAETYQPIKERGGWFYFKYLIGKLGIKTLAEAHLYKGRGYVQITGKTNYKKFDGIGFTGLYNNPELALVPDYAYRILVIGMTEGLFTGFKLTKQTSEQTFIRDRRVVNGKDKAVLIASYAKKFLTILEDSIVI